MEKAIIITSIAIIVIICVVIFGLIGISTYNYVDYGEKEGTVIDKEYHAAHTLTEYQTIRTGDKTTTIPVPKYYPETFNIKIQKEEGKELKEIWIQVPSEKYNEIEIGDYYK